jgi:hypothetical protein
MRMLTCLHAIFGEGSQSDGLLKHNPLVIDEHTAYVGRSGAVNDAPLYCQHVPQYIHCSVLIVSYTVVTEQQTLWSRHGRPGAYNASICDPIMSKNNNNSRKHTPSRPMWTQGVPQVKTGSSAKEPTTHSAPAKRP